MNSVTVDINTGDILSGFFVQYDHGQVINLAGDVPEAYQAEICNTGSISTSDLLPIVNNAISVPDVYLLSGANLLLYIVLIDEVNRSRNTVCKVEIPVHRRPAITS